MPIIFTIVLIFAKMKKDKNKQKPAQEPVSAIYGKSMTPIGVPPAICMVDPKYPYNVGAAVRAASCFGIKQVWFSGNRVSLSPSEKYRLPREERMKGYKNVELRQYDYFFDQFPDAVPVAVELRPNAQLITDFIHPENAIYVFGPEDGSLDSVHLRHCHHLVVIPTFHCVNLSAAIYIVLYDRFLKRLQAGLEPTRGAFDCLNEIRGISEPLEFAHELVV